MIALLLLLFAASAAQATTLIHVLLIGGQSNADGRANPTGLPTSPVNLQLPQDDVSYYYSTSLTTLRPRATEFGPEITFGRSMADFYAPYGEKVAVVKYAAGGTNLYSQWKAGGDATTTGDGPIYVSWQTTIPAGLTALQAANPGATLVIDGMIWVQGESDLASGAANSAAYGANLTAFIADVRATLGLPNMPFFLSRISSRQTVYSLPADADYPNYLTMRSQQASVADSVAGAYLIDTDDAAFTMNVDNLHFGPGGQQALGNAFATALQAVVPAPWARVSNVLATPVVGQVSLTWDAFSVADSYQVQRSSVGGGPYTTIASGLTSPSYVDQDVIGGVTYYYVITAISGGVETGKSYQVAGMPTAFTNAQAEILTWDPLHTGTSSDGSGTWDVSTANFATVGASVAYTASPSGSLTVSAFSSGTNTITVGSATGLVNGLGISLSQFPAGTTISNIAGTSVTMSTSATASLGTATTATFNPIHTAVFGSTGGTAGTVTVSGTQKANAMVINASGTGSYTFTGGAITLGSNSGATGDLLLTTSATINSSLSTKSITFGTTGQSLTCGGGGSLIKLTGSTSAIAAASTVTLKLGTYTGSFSFCVGNVDAGTGGVIIGTGSGTVTANSSATLNIGNGGSGLVTVNSGGTLNALASGLCVGRSAGNSGRLVINSGGTVNSSVPLLVGFSGAAGGVLDVSGGTLSLTSTTAAAGSMVISSQSGTIPTVATVNLSGGTLSTGTAGAVNFGNGGGFSSSTAGSGALNVTGGSLYLGSGGILKGGSGSFTNTVSLSGGVVGARANWSSSLPMTLGTTNGNISFQAANSVGTPFDIALTGTLSGPGGLNKTGGGRLTLSGANTFGGNTMISEGTLALTGNGNLANSPEIDVRAGASFDVSAVAFSLGVGKSLTGAGTVIGPVVAAGVVAPGNGIGTLTTGATTLTGTLSIEANGALCDKLVTNGNLNIAGATLSLSLLGAFSGPYVVAECNGGVLSGTFASIPAGYNVTYTATQAILSNYSSWEAFHAATGGPHADSDQDGTMNGIEFVLGGDPSAPDSNSILPTITTDPTYLSFIFRRTAESAVYNPFVEYGSTLQGWTPAQEGVDGVIINESKDAFPGGDSVEVKIPLSLAPPGAGKLFVRLRVQLP